MRSDLLWCLLSSPFMKLTLTNFIWVIFLLFFKKHKEKGRYISFAFKLACFMPLSFSMLFMAHNYCFNYEIWFIEMLLPNLIISIGAALYAYIDNKKIYSFALAFVLFVSLIPSANISLDKLSFHNYSNLSYSESFIKLTDILKEEYPLLDWKNINVDELKEKYIDEIKKAEKEKDDLKLAGLFSSFVDEFEDAHFRMEIRDENILKNLDDEAYGYSYGIAFSVTGDKVLVTHVEKGSKAENLGITFGCEITEINGITFKDAQSIENSVKLALMGEKKPFMTAKKASDDILKMKYIDANGAPQSAELSKEGSFSELNNMLFERCLLSYKYDNLKHFTEDSIGYIRLKDELWNSFYTAYSALKGSGDIYSKKLSGIISEMKEQGMRGLILDLRDNEGGLLEASLSIASLFSDYEEDIFYCKKVQYLGKNFKGSERYILKDGPFKDLCVVILVNNNTVSAGEILADAMSDFNNVHVIGSCTKGSAQMGGGFFIAGKGDYIFRYPVSLDINSEGNPVIDNGFTEKKRIGLEALIEYDLNAYEMMNNGIDYDYTYAAEYIKSLID